MKRIALLFDRTYVDAHSCFTELARHLSKGGYEVHLYCLLNSFNPVPVFYDSNIRVLLFPRSKFERIDFWQKVLFAKEYKYNAVIGTPFEGIFLAQKVAKKLRIPIIYMADEIYNDKLDRHEFPDYRLLKKKDINANAFASATISLGEERFSYQKKINKLPESHTYFVIPNAPAGTSVQLKSNYFRDIFGIIDTKPIVLFIGTLGWSLAKKLFESSRKFKEKDYHLIFHSRTLGQMGNEEHPFIKISKTPVDSNMLNYVVSSADIGLVLYDKDSVAEKENTLTGGKIGSYLKNNLPLIAGNVLELKQLEEKGLGVYINDISEIDAAIFKIQNDRHAYKKNIEEVYAREYNYSVFYKSFETYLNGVIQ